MIMGPVGCETNLTSFLDPNLSIDGILYLYIIVVFKLNSINLIYVVRSYSLKLSILILFRDLSKRISAFIINETIIHIKN
jgi:hypothetical protein